MALYDRDYVRDDGAGRGGLAGLRTLSVNVWIIIINVAVFVVGMVKFGDGSLGQRFTDLGHLSTDKLIFHWEVWRVITFQFLHAGIAHVFFNMFGLYMFGNIVERHLGGRRYAAFYLVCGVAGGLMYLFLNFSALVFAYLHLPAIPGLLITNPATPLVGASAGVFGVIMACAYIAPNAVVQLLFPPVPIRLKLLAYGYVGIALFNVLFGGQNAGGDAAHVGGAIAGFFFIRRSHLLHDFFDIFGKRDDRPRRRAEAVRPAGRGPDMAEVDRILAKVRDEGLASLSEREKAALRNATEAQRRA